MKVQKMVSLTPETADKAERMDNFSLYVRECLAGDLHLRHESMKRTIERMVKALTLAKEKGSQHPDFIKTCERMLI